VPRKSRTERLEPIGLRVDEATLRMIDRIMDEEDLTQADAIRALLAQGLERYVPSKSVTMDDAMIASMKAVRMLRQARKNEGV